MLVFVGRAVKYACAIGTMLALKDSSNFFLSLGIVLITCCAHVLIFSFVFSYLSLSL